MVCHTNDKRKEYIIQRARSTARIYQQHWSSLEKQFANATPVRTHFTPIGARYKPRPFLSIHIGSNRKWDSSGDFNEQLHQKGDDYDGFWLDVVGAFFCEAGEVETGDSGQVYTRPGAVVHKRYAVKRSV